MRVGYTHKQKQGDYYYYCSNSLALLKEEFVWI